MVIEIWNLVFIQFNRKADGSLEQLPSKHVDTGMGFERLCMAIQGKQSNYDTDVFTPVISELVKLSGKKYGDSLQADIAMRVIADHLRAISFSIADGQLPSNNKAGYVIRRILRRAVRYGYTFLDFREPFITKLVQILASNMGHAFPELINQKTLIEKVIMEEENAFLKTLDNGIALLDQIILKAKTENKNVVNGKTAFELYDTYGFPLDLTQLIAKEAGFDVDVNEFTVCMEEQKNRSRNAAVVDTEDWIIVDGSNEQKFVGYDVTEAKVKIIKYRKIKIKNEEQYQLVFDVTPFYAESGGQIGDTGFIEAAGEKILIIDTKKENNLSVHLCPKLPADTGKPFKAIVDVARRKQIENNHTATHLLHQALREILGTHVEQKGSLVHPEYLRFDFSHFQKMSDEEIRKTEVFVNHKIRENFIREENRFSTMEQAKEIGAIALFGEKYGDQVRTIKFGTSVELCGGTHAQASGQIGFFKINSESAIAAGIRRIEAITSVKAEEFIYKQLDLIDTLKAALKNPKDLLQSAENLLAENASLQKQLEAFEKEKIQKVKQELLLKIEEKNGVNLISEKLEMNAGSVKELAFELKNQVQNLVMIIGSVYDDKPSLSIMISDNLVKEKKYHAGNIVREAAKEINGGGGGQPFYATAGGKSPEGLQKAIEKAKGLMGFNELERTIRILKKYFCKNGFRRVFLCIINNL